MGMTYNCLCSSLQLKGLSLKVCHSMPQENRQENELLEPPCWKRTSNWTILPTRVEGKQWNDQPQSETFGSIIFRHNSHLNMVEIYHTSAAGIDLHSETAGHQYLASMVNKGGRDVQHQKWCKTSAIDRQSTCLYIYIYVYHTYIMWYCKVKNFCYFASPDCHVIWCDYRIPPSKPISQSEVIAIRPNCLHSCRLGSSCRLRNRILKAKRKWNNLELSVTFFFGIKYQSPRLKTNMQIYRQKYEG